MDISRPAVQKTHLEHLQQTRNYTKERLKKDGNIVTVQTEYLKKNSGRDPRRMRDISKGPTDEQLKQEKWKQDEARLEENRKIVESVKISKNEHQIHHVATVSIDKHDHANNRHLWTRDELMQNETQASRLVEWEQQRSKVVNDRIKHE